MQRRAKHKENIEAAFRRAETLTDLQSEECVEVIGSRSPASIRIYSRVTEHELLTEPRGIIPRRRRGGRALCVLTAKPHFIWRCRAEFKPDDVMKSFLSKRTFSI